MNESDYMNLINKFTVKKFGQEISQISFSLNIKIYRNHINVSSIKNVSLQKIVRKPLRIEI